MTIDGAHGDHQLAGDLGVRVALTEQAQHVYLTGGQPGRVNPRFIQRPARDPGHAQRAQAPAEAGGQRFGAQLVQRGQGGQQVLRVRALRQGRSVLVRAPRFLPERGGLPPPPRRLHRVGVVAMWLNAMAGLASQ